MNLIGPLLGMGLAGVLTIALIVSADQSNAGIEDLRALTAHPPASEQDAAAPPGVPVLSGLAGLLDGIRELPLFGPSPVNAAAGASAVPGGDPAPATGPASPPSDGPGPVATPPPASTVAPTATNRPSASPAPTPSATPTPSVTPTPATPPPSVPSTPAPTPSATPTPAPTLALSTDRGATAIVALADLVPGDTIDRTITLKNSGTLAFRYAVSATQTASSPLWTDTTNGVQLIVAAVDGTVLYTGPLSGLGALASTTVLAPGDIELLRYTFALPAGAPNSFQGLVQDLTLVFTATQYP